MSTNDSSFRKTSDSEDDSDTVSRSKSQKNRSKSKRIAKAGEKTRASKSRIKRSLKLLFGERDFIFQSYGPKGKEQPPIHPDSARLSASSKAIAQLARISDQGMNVAVVPNVMDGDRRRKEDAREIRYLFADCDKPGHTPNSLMTLAVTPTFVVETSPKRFHVYWRIEGCSVAEFSAVQRSIAHSLGSDASVSDPSRAMRLPGTVNVNHEPPFVARLLHPSKGTDRGPRIDFRKFMKKMKLDVETVEAVADAKLRSAKVDDHSMSDAQIDELLEKFDPSDYADWHMVGKALRSRYDDRGKWDAWSSRCREKFKIKRQRKEWDKFRPDGGTTIGTLVHIAGQRGGFGAAGFAGAAEAGGVKAHPRRTRRGELDDG